MKQEASENLERKVSQLISRLEKVKAPNNFSSKLRVKIASEKQKREKRKILLTRLSYAFSVLIVISSIVVFGYVLKSRNLELASYEEIPTVVEENLSEHGLSTRKPVDHGEREFFSDQKSEKLDEGKENSNRASVGSGERVGVFRITNKSAGKLKSQFLSNIRENKYRSKHTRRAVEFSRTEAASVPKTTRLSSGSFLEMSSARPRKAKIQVLELLRQIGIEGSFQEDGGFKVKSLKPNSLAEKSGIKLDDLILAIGEKKLENQEIYFDLLEIKEVKVKRKSEELNITLRP